MKAVVCFSGGLDSTVSLYWAKKNYDEVLALFFSYGQKAYASELKAAKYFSDLLQIKLQELNLEFIKTFSKSALNDESIKVPQEDEIDILDNVQSLQTAKAVWVPNRNGLFINAAASLAEALNFNHVVVGFNQEEAMSFPDNSNDFVLKINESLKYSTATGVEVVSPTIFLQKKEIVSMGEKLKVNFEKIWPCYLNGETICRKCESCKRYLAARGESEN